MTIVCIIALVSAIVLLLGLLNFIAASNTPIPELGMAAIAMVPIGAIGLIGSGAAALVILLR